MAFQDLYTSSVPLTAPDTTFKRDPERSIADNILEQGMQQQIYNFLQRNQKIREHADEIEQVVNLLSNDLSKQEYCQEIAFHTLKYFNFDFAYPLSSFDLVKSKMFNNMAAQVFNNPKFPSVSVHPSDQDSIKVMMVDTFVVGQYRYRNLVKVEKGDIFIDAGACYGDSSLWAYQEGAAKVYSFEPGEINKHYLKINLDANHYDSSLIQPYALGEENTKLTFFSGIGIGGASCIAAEKDYAMVEKGLAAGNSAASEYLHEVQCVRLDDWCAEHNVEPTFIKMDIEGAELGALKGAEKTLQRLKPKLAICLYHKTEDMWTIPLYLHSIVPEYKFYCKKNNIIHEFVLYATV